MLILLVLSGGLIGAQNFESHWIRGLCTRTTMSTSILNAAFPRTPSLVAVHIYLPRDT